MICQKNIKKQEFNKKKIPNQTTKTAYLIKNTKKKTHNNTLTWSETGLEENKDKKEQMMSQNNIKKQDFNEK